MYDMVWMAEWMNERFKCPEGIHKNANWNFVSFFFGVHFVDSIFAIDTLHLHNC